MDIWEVAGIVEREGFESAAYCIDSNRITDLELRRLWKTAYDAILELEKYMKPYME